MFAEFNNLLIPHPEFNIKMHTLTRYPNAKINLGLQVVERRNDGYHNLQTVFYPLPLCDELTISKGGSGDYTLVVDGLFVTENAEDNLVVKAYKLLQKSFNLPPVHIHLQKVIPFGAGLGGGSSDAAFTIKMLNELFELHLSDDELEAYAVQIGADCPFFIKNQPVFATGIGNVFIPLANFSLKGLHWILIKPDIHVSTPAAYASLTPRQPDYDLRKVIYESTEVWNEQITNDFETTVFRTYPAIAELKAMLYNNGAIYASMSGSGSSVYGLFKELPPLFNHREDELVFRGIF